MFLFAVALAVSAIPEGFPVGITVALGVASRRMAKVGVIVPRLVAVEGLGSCTMIASDKTGTLTANELTVKQVQLPGGRTFEVTGEEYASEESVLRDGHPPEPDLADELSRLARASVLCNEGHLSRRDDEWAWRGDPTDIALPAFGHKLGWFREAALDANPQIDEIPFEPEQRYAATFHETPDREQVFVKGAPERVLEMCSDASEGDFSRHELQQQATEMAHEGYRVLAVAEGTLETTEDLGQPPSEPTGLTFLGFLGMIDPLRSGVEEAITSAQQAGITVTIASCPLYR
jgi:magnesium-transporting ATPase (P-type)